MYSILYRPATMPKKKNTDETPIVKKTTRKTTTKSSETATKKPAAKKKSTASVTKKTAVASKPKPAPVKKRSTVKKSVTSASLPQLTQEERAEQTRVAAYYRWQQRNMEHGCDVQDWLDAENELTL